MIQCNAVTASSCCKLLQLSVAVLSVPIICLSEVHSFGVGQAQLAEKESFLHAVPVYHIPYVVWPFITQDVQRPSAILIDC